MRKLPLGEVKQEEFGEGEKEVGTKEVVAWCGHVLEGAVPPEVWGQWRRSAHEFKLPP